MNAEFFAPFQRFSAQIAARVRGSGCRRSESVDDAGLARYAFRMDDLEHAALDLHERLFQVSHHRGMLSPGMFQPVFDLRVATATADKFDALGWTSGVGWGDWDLLALIRACRSVGFTDNECHTASLLAFDLLYQLEMLCSDHWLHLANTSNAGFRPGTAGLPPLVGMLDHSFLQTLVLKVRVLWERMMNLVYFLAVRKDFDPGGKSRKRAFFKAMAASPQWAFMEEFRALIERLDEGFRTAEAHKQSRLAKAFRKREAFEPEPIFEAWNAAVNASAARILAALTGDDVVANGTVVAETSVGMPAASPGEPLEFRCAVSEEFAIALGCGQAPVVEDLQATGLVSDYLNVRCMSFEGRFTLLVLTRSDDPTGVTNHLRAIALSDIAVVQDRPRTRRSDAAAGP